MPHLKLTSMIACFVEGRCFSISAVTDAKWSDLVLHSPKHMCFIVPFWPRFSLFDSILDESNQMLSDIMLLLHCYGVSCYEAGIDISKCTREFSFRQVGWPQLWYWSHRGIGRSKFRMTLQVGDEHSRRCVLSHLMYTGDLPWILPFVHLFSLCSSPFGLMYMMIESDEVNTNTLKAVFCGLFIYGGYSS